MYWLVPRSADWGEGQKGGSKAVNKDRLRGLTALLTRAAADFARDHGATALEVYPTDTDEDKHPATVYTGIASTFRRLGFETVQARAPHKPMMRLLL